MQFMSLFSAEPSLSMKESLMGALSSFLRSENYEAKADFLKNWSGLQFIAATLQKPDISVRMIKKVIFLLNDIVLTDE